MVKPVRQKNNVLLTFRVTPPINPATTKRISHPRVCLVPREFRRLAWNESLEGFEPVSPRVSCTGHVGCQMKRKQGAWKHKQASSPLVQALAEQIKRKVLSVRKCGYESDAMVVASEIEETAAPNSLRETRQFCKGRSMFSYFARRTYDEEEKGEILNGRKRGGYEFDVFDVEAVTEAQSAPSLQQMRRICTGRSTLSDRDWSTYGTEEKEKVSKGRKRSYEFDVSDAQTAAADIVAPSLQNMKQFGKGRSTLSDFDWKANDPEEKGKVTKRGYESNVSDPQAAVDTVSPSLHRMRQFCKGRSTLSEFDRRREDAKEKGVKRKRI